MSFKRNLKVNQPNFAAHLLQDTFTRKYDLDLQYRSNLSLLIQLQLLVLISMLNIVIGRPLIQVSYNSYRLNVMRIPSLLMLFTATLFDASVLKVESNPKGHVCKHLQLEARGTDVLVLWMDCDREGENICFEVIDNTKHWMNQGAKVYRARFSGTCLSISNYISIPK